MDNLETTPTQARTYSLNTFCPLKLFLWISNHSHTIEIPKFWYINRVRTRKYADFCCIFSLYAIIPYTEAATHLLESFLRALFISLKTILRHK